MNVKVRRRRVDPAETDRAFDDLVPDELRHLSELHWTPIPVTIHIANILGLKPDDQVLDVGAGIGKFCTVGALSSPATWVGIEQHASLVRAGERLARALGVGDRTRLLIGDAFSIDWNAFDVVYLYNPFELTNRSELVERTEQRLAKLPVGARVVTLHGFGGVMPPSFDLVYRRYALADSPDLACWVQRPGKGPR